MFIYFLYFRLLYRKFMYNCMEEEKKILLPVVKKKEKKIGRYSKIKQKVKQIKLNYTRLGADPIRNIFAINSLGATIVISTILYIYVVGILSLFFPESNFHFLREMMRILECISISIVSYFFGGIFKKDKTKEQ